MDEVFTISSGSLFQYGTTRTLNVCWRRRVIHRCWWILKVWPRSPMRVGAAKTVSHWKSRRPCIILYMQIRSPRILLRTREKSRSRWWAVSYGTWRNPFTNFTASFWTLSSYLGSNAAVSNPGWGLLMRSKKGQNSCSRLPVGKGITFAHREIALESLLT